MLLKAKNTQHEIAQGHSFLSSAGTAGQTIFGIKNVNGFAANYAMQVGETGQERSELMLISGAPAAGLATTASTALYPHPADSPVYCYRYNQVVFEVSTTGTAGTASAIASGTVTVMPDSEYTVFDYTTAATADAYKTKYRNSALAAESSESDWIKFAGYPQYALASLRDRIKSKAPDVSIQDDTLSEWVNEWREEMTNAAVSVNEFYCMGTMDLAYSGTTELATITATDFLRPARIWYTEDGSNWYRSVKVDMNTYYPEQDFAETAPRHYYQGDNILGRLPYERSGTMRVWYYSSGTQLVNDGDELPLSMRSYTKSFVDYGLAQVNRSPQINKDDVAERMEASAEVQKQRFTQDISPKDHTGPEYVEIVEAFEGH